MARILARIGIFCALFGVAFCSGLVLRTQSAVLDFGFGANARQTVGAQVRAKA